MERKRDFVVTSSFSDKIGVVIHLEDNKALVSLGLIERCKTKTTPTPLEFKNYFLLSNVTMSIST